MYAYTARIIYGRSAYIQWVRTRRTLSSLAMNHADVDATTAATVLLLHKKADRKRERAEGRGKKEKTAVPYNTTTTAA